VNAELDARRGVLHRKDGYGPPYPDMMAVQLTGGALVAEGIAGGRNRYVF